MSLYVSLNATTASRRVNSFAENFSSLSFSAASIFFRFQPLEIVLFIGRCDGSFWEVRIRLTGDCVEDQANNF